MLSYASKHKCRRSVILEHFGETCPSHTRCCDVCDPRPVNDTEVDITKDAKIALRALRDVAGGPALICSLLAGSCSKRVKNVIVYSTSAKNHWGVGAPRTETFWKDIVEKLVQGGILDRRVSRKGYPIVSIGENGQGVLEENVCVFSTTCGAVVRRKSKRELVCKAYMSGVEPEEIAISTGLSENVIVDILLRDGLAEESCD